MTSPQMQSPAPRVNVGNRAEGIRNDASPTIFAHETEANFAAIYLARRYGLALPIARTIAALASLGRAFG